MNLLEEFCKLFAGNTLVHYTFDPKRKQPYTCVKVRGERNHELDARMHLEGIYPSLLSVPILPSGLCHFAAGDCDRHFEIDEPIDHAAIARKITELGLPLIITKSKSPKSAHIWLFFADRHGFDAAMARRLIEKYMLLLGITGDVEIFPKQETLKPGSKGSGINLPYFGGSSERMVTERVAFGKDGEELDLAGFIALAHERMAFGEILARRDLADLPSGHRATSDTTSDKPLPISAIRKAHAKHLETLRESNTVGHWDDALNICIYYAAKAYQGGALTGTEADIKAAIRTAASARSGYDAATVEKKLGKSWEDGIMAPLEILDTEKEHKEAMDRTCNWIADKFPLRNSEDVYSDLALLTREEYDDLRQAVADGMQKRVSALDEFVARRRAKIIDETKLQEIEFLPSEPWPEPVNGAELLGDLTKMFKRFIVFKHEFDAETMAAWAVGTYLYDTFKVFPRLGFTSPFPDSGKSTGLDMMEHTCLRALKADNLTSSILFRVMELWHPSFLLDELDTYYHDNKELQGVLNSGHKAGGFVWRTNTEDEKMRPERFGTFGPISFAMLHHPGPTLYSRSIFIRLERKNSDQVVEDFDTAENAEQGEQMTVLRRKIVRWTSDHRTEIMDCRPNTGKLSNRMRGNWRPLLKIAEVAGGDWPRLILTAAGVPPPPVKKSEQEKLLRDIRDIFYTRGVDRIPSHLLVSDLLLQKQSGWTRYHNGRENLDEADLADLLIDFAVLPKPMAINQELQRKLFETSRPKDITKRGYTLDQFQPLIDTYISGAAEEVPVSGKEPF